MTKTCGQCKDFHEFGCFYNDGLCCCSMYKEHVLRNKNDLTCDYFEPKPIDNKKEGKKNND